METWRESLRQADRKLLLGACFALSLLAFCGFLTLHNAHELVRTSERVSSIHTTITAEQELLARLNEAETGLFGYVITGNEQFLAPYLSATNDIARLLGEIRARLVDHDDAGAMLRQLKPLMDERLALMAHRVAARRTGGFEAAATLVQEGEAKAVMDRIRRSITALTEHEAGRLQDMQAQSERTARRMVSVDIVFGALSVTLLALIFAFLMRENVTRRRTEADLRQAGHDLEMRVAERTADLARTNACLQVEVEEHRRAQEALRASERQLAETARALDEKNKDLEMLIYVASHDLRSPLLNIRGFADELVRTCAEIQQLTNRSNGHVSKPELTALLADVPEATGFINAGVTRMDTLLSGFLRLSRLGREAIRIARLDMNALLSNVARSFEFQLREAGATIHLDRLPKCSGDAAQVIQVFSNLIDNAVKYRAPERPLQIEVSAESADGKVAYRVKDNGAGISAADQQKIFEVFYRVSGTICEGEGLGLAIARRILDRLNGRITVESEPGVGTTFTVSLPASPERMDYQSDDESISCKD